MTDVLVRLTAPSSGAAASGWVPADEVAAVGHLECRPYAPDADGARLHLEAPDRLLLPASFTVRLVAGEALLHLAPTGAGWCWQIIERTPRGKTRYVLVPDSAATLEYAELPDVDPATLEPTAVPEAAWWAAVDGIGGDIGQAVADYLTANPPAVGGLDSLSDVDTTGQAEGDVLTLGPLGEWGPAAVPAPDLSGYVPTSDARLTDARTPLAHTHTSTAITDWAEAVQDTVAAMLTSGTNVTLSYDDAAGTLSVTAAGGDAEVMRDTIGAALVGINGVTVTVNDALDTITLAITGLTIAQVTGLQGALDGKAPTLGSDDNYVTDAEKASLHTHPAVIAQGATQADARTAIGLGTAATTAATDYATAAQGTTADSAVQPGDDAADLGSGAAADGHVLTADGAGGAAWEAPSGGGGSGLPDVGLPKPSGGAAGAFAPGWSHGEAWGNYVAPWQWISWRGYYLTSARVLDSLVLNIRAANAGQVATVALYEADVNWQPTNLVYGPPEFDASALGTVTLGSALGISMPAGRYVIGVQPKNNVGGGMTLFGPHVSTASFIVQDVGAAATGGSYRDWKRNVVYTAFTNPAPAGIKWTAAAGLNGVPLVFMRFSA